MDPTPASFCLFLVFSNKQTIQFIQERCLLFKVEPFLLFRPKQTKKRETSRTRDSESQQEAKKVYLDSNQKLAIAQWIFEEKEVLFGKLANNITTDDKTKTWDAIFHMCEAKGYPIPDAKYLRNVQLFTLN